MISDRSRPHVPPEPASDLAVNLGMGGASWNQQTGEASATIRYAPEQSESDGSVPFGFLATIADNNNAMANINSAAWGDNSILLQVAYQTSLPARGTVEVRSYNSAHNEIMGVAQGVMLDDHGPFGQSQCTSVVVPSRPMVEDRLELPVVDHAAFVWASDLAPAPVDLYLRAGLQLDDGEAVYTTQLDSGWSSNYGSLHGGAVGLLITRAARYAALAASPPGVDHVPVSFDITYTRPAMVVPEPMRAIARVTARTRRFCTLEGELLLPSGKPAARCRVIHRLDPTG